MSMSMVAISYGSLKDASSESNAVAKKLDQYADSLYNNVYRKLESYNGNWSSNLSTAKSKTNAKITELRNEQSKYEAYAADLIELRDECEEVDKAVKSKVSSLTASFKEAHGIRNSHVENAISYFFTGLGNDTAFGRWLGDKKDEFDSGMNYIKDTIKEWYNFEGGKELLKGVLVGALEVAIGVLAIVGAILSGGVLVAIAGVVAGIITAANGFANIWNEQKAYSATQQNDPATGRRRSEIDTWQDYLRSSFIFGDDGEKYKYNEFYNGLATGIDVVNTACTVVTLANSLGSLLKNGYKWATGSAANLKDITMKQIFSKDTLTKFKTKFSDIKAAFHSKGWTTAKDLGGRMLKNFGQNLKKEFWDFTSANGDFNAEGAASSLKNMLTIPKELLKEGVTLSNLANLGINNVLFPGLTAFTVNSTDGTVVTGTDGQLQFDFTEKVNFQTMTSLFKDGSEVTTTMKDLFTNDSGIDINREVLDKLSSSCDISISIPEIDMPEINLPLGRAA